MNFNPLVLQAIEQNNYRVTVGDLVTTTGLELNIAQHQLNLLASNTNGHLQVADTGDIVYLFPKQYKSILRNKFFKIRLQETWDKIWKILFYLIRISFGVFLILSIILMTIAIIAILLSLNSGKDNNNNRGKDSDGGIIFLPFRLISDMIWLFNPTYDYHNRPIKQEQEQQSHSSLNFLEAIFSFLFGDGDPNAKLEEKRWQEIGIIIRNNKGAVFAEQIAPYLDIPSNRLEGDEDYMLSTLTRFNGYPQVSPKGELIYVFPELQTVANLYHHQTVSPYLQEEKWLFSKASSGQILGAIGLGTLNFILALVLSSLAKGITVTEAGLVGFVVSIQWLLSGYGTAFLGIPLIRYFWLQIKNSSIEKRNQLRQKKSLKLQEITPQLQEKMNYARQFAQQQIISQDRITYSTETDLLDQNIQNKAKLDAEWEKRLPDS